MYQNANLALVSGDENVECGAATQWKGLVLWRRVEGKVVQTHLTQFVTAFSVGVEGLKGCLPTFGSVQHESYDPYL